jgi:uncharacterized protein YllA (UPF0747 family)
MSTGGRLKINKNSNALVKRDPYNLSPNAALRPFYQEWILPNLVYVGGPSEIKYWLQLKGIFDNYSVPMPILHLRTSNTLISQRQISKLSKDDIIGLFSSKVEIAKNYSEVTSILATNLETKYGEILKAIENYNLLISSSFKGFSIEGKIKKINPKLAELQEITKVQLKKHIDSNQDLNKVLKIKDKYFNPENVQERNDHVIAHVYLLDEVLLGLDSHFGFIFSQKIGLLFT